MTCLHCGRPFEGRPNKTYCTRRCKKNAEHQRAKLKRLCCQYPALRLDEEKAREAGDWHAVRLCRARRDRIAEEVARLSDSRLFQDSPDWLAPLRLSLERFRPKKGPES